MIEDKTVYRDMAARDWHEKIEWCKENLYHGGHYEPKWHRSYPFIEFDDKQEYLMFTLRYGY